MTTDHTAGTPIMAEPDPLQRARNSLAHVGALGDAIDKLPEVEQQYARMDGREAQVAGLQRIHVQLAAASAQVAIAEQLVRIGDLLEQQLERMPDPLWAEKAEAAQQRMLDAELAAKGAPLPGFPELPDGGRYPYVGKGADGCRRSAQMDLEEAHTLSSDDPRRQTLEASAARWQLQAAWHDGQGHTEGDGA